MQNKPALEILLGALSDAEWMQLKQLRESKNAFRNSDIVVARKTSAVQFANWILKHTVNPGYDENGWACWVLADGTDRVFTSTELYEAYINGLFDPEEDDEEN